MEPVLQRLDQIHSYSPSFPKIPLNSTLQFCLASKQSFPLKCALSHFVGISHFSIHAACPTPLILCSFKIFLLLMTHGLNATNTI
jgi:hypothetical protein